MAAGVNVNAVLPGAVRTPPTGRQLPSTVTPAGPITTSGRLPQGLADPGDISGIVLLLAAPAGRYITGQTFVVDGGFLVPERRGVQGTFTSRGCARAATPPDWLLELRRRAERVDVVRRRG